ncbi:uncharacterized protein LOC134774797 [Penaeus indicus]|uniref:uncharacterized protein LOC134774797 n=1 Tax=Penaeus indicus TaxID=29960 RepID=UPI00300D7FB5
MCATERATGGGGRTCLVLVLSRRTSLLVDVGGGEAHPERRIYAGFGVNPRGEPDVTMGVWAALLVVAMVGGALAAPPAPTATKRSAEDIQFGNQQNPPVSLLDDSALPGAFPSSETSEETRPPKQPAEAPEEPAPKEKPTEAKEAPHREPMERDLPPVALASRWPFHGPRSVRLYRPRQYLPGVEARKTLIQQVSPRVLEFGHRHKRDLRPLTRRPRDLASNVNLDNLLRNVDVVELLGCCLGGAAREVQWAAGPMGAGALGTGPRGRNHQLGFGTLSYAPMSPATPKFSPQPRVFPEYEETKTRTKARRRWDQGLGDSSGNPRDLRPLTRRPRDLASNVNLDNLLRNVDVVELLGLLSRGGGQGGPMGAGPMGAGALGTGPRGRNHQLGFGTLSYAPMSPATPKFSPQPRVFPEYEEDEDEDEGEEAMGPGARGQQWYPVVPAGGRVWRRSGALGLSAVPGFKRSAFRANNMQAQRARNQDDDLYSLAAMLGAELDPATHRIQRAAM